MLFDRLETYDDDGSSRHLHVPSEFNLHTSIQNENSYGGGRVSGQADCTGCDLRRRRGIMLLQQFRSCLLVLPGVQDGHMAAEKIKYDIFGITREP
jgi:hypothetical protein